MNWNDVIQLLEQGEGQSVEFEKTIPSPDDIAREMVAFSNSDGGKLVFGMDDKNKHLLGIDLEEDTLNKILEVGRTRCVPTVTPYIDVLEKGSKKIIVLSIHEGDEKPYKTDEICYIRDGDISRPAREYEEDEIKSPWSGQDLNKRQKRSLQLITEHGNITNREYREAFGVSHKTAHIELTMLADKKILEAQGAGRNTHYILPNKE